MNPLTDNDKLLTEALVRSPVFSVLCKVIDLERIKTLSALELEKDIAKVRILQGKLQGLNCIKNLPVIVTAQYQIQIEKEKKAKEKEEKKKKNKS